MRFKEMSKLIKTIKIRNFQRINSELELPVSRLTVLVGENGSGKSSILKSIHWSARCATLADAKGKVTLDQMDFVPSKDFLDLGHKLKLQNTTSGRSTSVTFIDEDLEKTTIDISAARNEAGVKVSAIGPLVPELSNDSAPSTAFIPGLSGLAEEETILATPVMHRKAASGEGGSALRQVLLQCAGKGDGTGSSYEPLGELEKWVGKVLIGVKFWVKFDRLRDKNIEVRFLTPDMKVPGQSERVAWKAVEMAGTGFLQIVQIFAYLLYFKPKLLLVDEPDAHLHPSKQQSLIRALDEASKEFPGTQIIVSTHSPNLVRALPDDARIHWISEGDVKAQGKTVREKMGWSALDKDAILFTEDGNLKYLEAVLALRPSIQNRVLLWPTFGKDALPDGPKAKSIAKKMGVEVLVHRDRDFMSDQDVTDWASGKSYDTCNIKYWVPNGSDIESLFLDPAYLASTLQVEPAIVQEIEAFALNSFDEHAVMQEFSDAYQSATNKLPSTQERNPIARWGDLGSFGKSTIKGKEYLQAFLRGCANVLPQHGLGRNIGNRNKIGNSPVPSDECNSFLNELESLLS